MRTGAFRYLFFSFLFLLTDVTVSGFDWTPDLVGAAILLLGLRELKVFDAEYGAGFGKTALWGRVLLALGAGKAVLCFWRAAEWLLPWLCAASGLAAAVAAWFCGAGVFRLAIQAGQRSLVISLRQSVVTVCRCCVSVSCSKALSAGLGTEPSLLSFAIVTAASVAAALWFCAQLLRAQKLLRPFFG